MFRLSMKYFVVMMLMIAASSCAAPEYAKKNKPNILFIMMDDMGKEWVSSYGAEEITTPSIDMLAAKGMRFENVYVNPQCTPTRMELLTGQYPFRNGWVNHWDVPRWGHGYYDWEKNPSIGRVMKEAGYATMAAGKWQVNDFRVEPDAMNKLGFDRYAMWTGYEAGNAASGERYWDAYIHADGKSKTYEGQFGTDVFVESIKGFITDNKDTPWFAYFPLALPHPPMVTTPDEPNVKGTKERYAAMVRYADAAVGKLVSHIDELGLADILLLLLQLIMEAHKMLPQD